MKKNKQQPKIFRAYFWESEGSEFMDYLPIIAYDVDEAQNKAKKICEEKKHKLFRVVYVGLYGEINCLYARPSRFKPSQFFLQYN